MRTLSFGMVGQRPVFMDERTDSYFVLDPAYDEHLRRLLRDRALLARDPDLKRILGIDEPAEIALARHPSGSTSLLDHCGPRRASLVDICKIANVVLSTGARLRVEAIETLLASITTRAVQGPCRGSDGSGMVAQAVRFLDARRLVPFKRNCLLDSLSLLRWLGNRRSAAALLFGVKLDPFAAHCWVQSGDLVLNDRVENVAAFTPVRVIRCSEAMQ